jgi:hypothetical protein
MPLTKVSSGVIAANAVVDSFGTQSITGDKLGLTAINANNIVNASITGAKIALGTITGDDIATGQITGNLLTVNCVSGNNIVANTVTGDKIGQSAVSANNISTGATIRSSSSAQATSSSINSNVYTNVHSNITLPDKSMIVAHFELTTSGGGTPSEATYGMYLSTTSVGSGKVAYQDGVSVYPQNGIGSVGGSLTYFNISGSSQSIWLAVYPYASANYNTPNANVTYRIVSFA